MRISRVRTAFFSPTGMTRHVALACADSLAAHLSVPVASVDFTLPAARQERYEFAPDELAVVATPTYAGKVPNKILPFVQSGIVGAGTPAIALVSFGNRAFDNSLAELVAVLERNGFSVVGAGAFVTRHSFSDTLAVGRPDEGDLAMLRDLAENVARKVEWASDAKDLESVSDLVPGDADAPYFRPLDLDGKPAVFLKAKPLTNPELCDGCGLCARLCPMGSISLENPADVPGTCIKCHSCVRNCPHGAKTFDDPALLSHKAMVERDHARAAASVAFA